MDANGRTEHWFREYENESPLSAKKSSSLVEREDQVVVADLDGTLLRSPDPFPYFLLVALEAGSLPRAVMLLLFYPVAWLLRHLVYESAGLQLLIFISCAGLKVRDIESVGRAVLPRFYAGDVHPETWRVFSSFSRKYIVTECPRVMVESFALHQLGADKVLGTELQVTATGRCTGFPKAPGILVGVNKKTAVDMEFADGNLPDLGIGDESSDQAFLSICKELQYVARTGSSRAPEPVPMRSLVKPVVFHDGRLVQRPTPLVALLVFAWMPLAFPISVLRVLICGNAPCRWWSLWCRAGGIRVIVKGKPPPRPGPNTSGVLFVCSHRTLLDPVFIAIALGRPVTAVTYSISRVSEILSPIRTTRLSRNQDKDSRRIKRLLREGDVVVCPEGTTSREAVLLRFSALFAELTDSIVPVAIETKQSMFHGTSARGWKALDPFFFLMNPRPTYELEFLEPLPAEMTCGGGGRSRYEVANHVQRVIAAALRFQCCSFTRRDKYRFLAGTDGSIVEKLSPK